MSKTNHQTGWHKKIVNPTTNYSKDSHAEFCKRCISFNGGCPAAGKKSPSKTCNL